MREKDDDVIVNKADWSLHHKGYQDQQRHMEKVKEAINENLADLISDESIITTDGESIVKIPIHSLDEYKICYNNDEKDHVGQGDGDSQIGDIVAQDNTSENGVGDNAGDQPGEDIYEVDVSITDVEEALFSKLALPFLTNKDAASMEIEKTEFNDIRKKGLIGNIDKKRTILSALRRNAREGKPVISPIFPDDVRYKTWNEVMKQESSAVVLAMMDTSGSMGSFEKMMSRSFFFWMTRFLRTKYDHVEIVFIAHHTTAKVVTEEEFFHKGESGGTICSSAYQVALQLIEETYHPHLYNIYPFHFSDGDNISSDNKNCIKLVYELMNVSTLFGYGEVNAYRRYSTLMSVYRGIDHPKFMHYILRKKQDVYQALTYFFQEREEA
ncbi:MAG TPA: sporulation protein YhbH [Pseudogracilibacillus sp.]|nr:sporulation protein YhbH [Pseudogracilibacillus sp.]